MQLILRVDCMLLNLFILTAFFCVCVWYLGFPDPKHNKMVFKQIILLLFLCGCPYFPPPPPPNCWG